MRIFEITIYWITIAPSYYWLMYAISFILWYSLLKKRLIYSEQELDNIMMYIFFWIIFWWRIWYILFYDLNFYISNPYEIFKVWKWWMSFHWWVIWVILSMIIYSIRHWRWKWSFYKLTDEIITLIPIWLWLWRIWNYLNKELLWKKYSWFLAVNLNWEYYFPSPLLEAFLEWLALYFILKYVYKNKKYNWIVSWAFLFFYWIMRITAEFIRMPDIQIWYIYWFVTMWQILSLPMVLIWLYFWKYFKKYPIETWK